MNRKIISILLCICMAVYAMIFVGAASPDDVPMLETAEESESSVDVNNSTDDENLPDTVNTLDIVEAPEEEYAESTEEESEEVGTLADEGTNETSETEVNTEVEVDTETEVVAEVEVVAETKAAEEPEENVETEAQSAEEPAETEQTEETAFIHAEGCDGLCTDEDCVCPCHDMELYERLLICTSIEEFDAVIEAAGGEEALAEFMEAQLEELNILLEELESEEEAVFVAEVSDPPVVSEVITPAKNFSHVAPFLPPIAG